MSNSKTKNSNFSKKYYLAENIAASYFKIAEFRVLKAQFSQKQLPPKGWLFSELDPLNFIPILGVLTTFPHASADNFRFFEGFDAPVMNNEM